MPSPPAKMKIFSNTGQKLLKNGYSIFPEVRYFTQKLEFVLNILWVIAERTLSDINVIESQKLYFLGEIGINFQPKDKEILRNKPVNTINKEIPHLTRAYLELCSTYSLEWIMRQTKVTDQTAALIDHTLNKSTDKFSQ